MVDKSYNVSVGYKNISNIYYDSSSNLTNLKSSITDPYFYFFKSAPVNQLGLIINPNQFIPFTYQSITIFYQGITGGANSGFYMKDNKWVTDDFTTIADTYPIPENSIIRPQIDKPIIEIGEGSIIKSYNCYYLNGIEASGLYFEKGKTYQFIQTEISNSGNPLNIYLDEYGNKKLEDYISISGGAGIDRHVTVSIPKTFTETNTLYYGNESEDFFGAPIKLISTDYYLKYNIKLLCFDVHHDNEKYIIPNKILTKNKNSYSQQSYTSGILPSINKYNNLYGGQAQRPYLTNIRTDVININLLDANKIFIKDNFNFDFFGNNLIYKKNSNNANSEWSNLYELYNLISDLCFTDSGSLNSGENFKNYYQYGYQLSGCEGCIDKLTLTTGNNNFYSGFITLFYNPRKIYKNYRSYPRTNINYEYFSNKDFVTSSYGINSGNFNYIKYTGTQAYYV